MKTNACRHLFLSTAMLAVAGTAAAEPSEPPVAVNVEGLPSHVRARILDKAAQGQTALIRYLHRTETVHHLRPQFVIRSREPASPEAKKAETKVAERDAGPAR